MLYTIFISIYLIYFFSKLFHTRVLMCNLEDLVSNEGLLSLLGQMLSGLLNGLLSLFDKDNNPEGPDPEGEGPEGPDPEGEDPDPEGEYPFPEGEDPDGNSPNPDKNDSDKDDSHPSQKLDKGKGRASTPESLPDSPVIPEEPSVPEEDDEQRFQKDLEKAKAASLEDDREKGRPESSKEGGIRENDERRTKQEVKDRYNQAVRDYNDNQSLIVDNENIDPQVKQALIEYSQTLREEVDKYKALKEELEVFSSEEEESGSEYYSGEESDSENSRPSKRPKND
jgi:hypothetical protein